MFGIISIIYLWRRRHFLGSGAGEAVSQAKVFGVGGKGSARPRIEDDRRPSQDVVPESENKMEVGMN